MLSTWTKVSDLPWHLALNLHPSPKGPKYNLWTVFFQPKWGISSHKDLMAQTGLLSLVKRFVCFAVLYRAALPFIWYLLVTLFIPWHCTAAYLPLTRFPRRLLTMTNKSTIRPLPFAWITGCNFQATVAFQAKTDSSTGNTKSFKSATDWILLV